VHESAVSAGRRSRRSTESAAASESQAPAHPPLPPVLESLFTLIAKPVLKLETAPDGKRTLRETSILLSDVLDLLEEDQSIPRATDRLYGAALVLYGKPRPLGGVHPNGPPWPAAIAEVRDNPSAIRDRAP
jgi:hypothetical protein